MNPHPAPRCPDCGSNADLPALLASHPEECADLLALLVARYPHRGIPQRDANAVQLLILDALCAAGVALQEGSVYLLDVSAEEHRAIARHGALAWLRARVGPATSTNPLNLGAIRLCALAAEGARIGAIHIASYAVATPFPRNAAEYRSRILDVSRLSEGLPMEALDIEAEVAAVWGPAPSPAKGTPT